MQKLKVYSGKVNRRKTIPVSQNEANLDRWLDFDGKPIDSQHMMISMLLPPAVKEFLTRLDSEVNSLCGAHYEHGTANQRWGSQDGSIVLGNQKVRIKRPRVRNMETKREVPLNMYDQFQNPNLFDEQIFTDGLRKVSQRDYKKGVKKIAASFGFTKSSVSRRWIKATEERLKELNERDLSALDIMAVFLDGKRFRDRGMVVALGVGPVGKKYVLGIYECNTENSATCSNLLEQLELRGLPDRELLFVVDGGSGLNKALEDRYEVHIPEKRRAVRVRCHAHKWRNIADNLPKEIQAKAAGLYWGMRDAARMDVAIGCADALEQLLHKENESSWKSFLEAKDDLLVLHKLHLSPRLKQFFSTTNPLESVNYLTEEDLRRVKRWEDSHHFQRWLAAASLEAEKRMHRVPGYKNLPALKAALSKLCSHENENIIDKEALTGT